MYEGACVGQSIFMLFRSNFLLSVSLITCYTLAGAPTLPPDPSCSLNVSVASMAITSHLGVIKPHLLLHVLKASTTFPVVVVLAVEA